MALKICELEWWDNVFLRPEKSILDVTKSSGISISEKKRQCTFSSSQRQNFRRFGISKQQFIVNHEQSQTSFLIQVPDSFEKQEPPSDLSTRNAL